MLAAIEAGYSHLGFSDHIPWPYEGGFLSQSRMDMAEFPDYIRSVKSLQAAYAGQIDIRLGLEVEHYPEYSAWLQETQEKHGVTFLVFGNHFDCARENVYYGRASSAEHVITYTDRALAGIASGLYDCFAHPDLFLQAYPQFDDTCRSASREICQAAKSMNLPLEYNLLGYYNAHRRRGGIGYPYLDFWQIAAQEGCSAIIGIDAHQPERLLDTPLYDLARQHLQALGMPIVTTL